VTGALRRRATLALFLGLTAPPAAWAADPALEASLRQYVQAVYSRDYTRAYALISAADREHKSHEAYLREYVSFTGVSREIAAQLASYITLELVRTELHGDRATVVVQLRLPDGNDPSLRTVLLNFEEPKLQALSATERREVTDRLNAMQRRGDLPVITGEDRFELVKESDGWRLVLGWGTTVRVRFVGEAKMGLPWTFAPVTPEVRAPPGETLRMTYRARNLSDTTTTGKARHRILPVAEHLEVIQCFCFIQQTLAPGEERDLVLTFRVKWDAPTDLKVIEVHYEFYPLTHFRPEWERRADR
jgi:hypothetical protein